MTELNIQDLVQQKEEAPSPRKLMYIYLVFLLLGVTCGCLTGAIFLHQLSEKLLGAQLQQQRIHTELMDNLRTCRAQLYFEDPEKK